MPMTRETRPSSFFPLLAQLVKAFRRTMELFVLRAPPAWKSLSMGSIKDQSIPIKKKKQVRNRLALVELPPSAHPRPRPRWVQQFTVSSFLPAALCVYLCFSYRRPVAPRQEPPPSAGASHLLTSSHLVPNSLPPPPRPPIRLSCRPSGRDGCVPAGRRPASSALATSLRANTYFPRIPGQAEAPLGRRGPRGSGNSQVGRGGR